MNDFQDEAQPGDTISLGGNARQQVKSYMTRIEALLEDKRAIGDDIKEIYSEAKSNGFNTKVMRRAIAERQRRAKMSDFNYEAEAHEIDLYLHAAAEPDR